MNTTREYFEQTLASGAKVLEEFEKETKNAYQTNCSFLMKILRDNVGTEYGKRYGFAEINSIFEFQKRVPVICYDDISQASSINMSLA